MRAGVSECVRQRVHHSGGGSGGRKLALGRTTDNILETKAMSADGEKLSARACVWGWVSG
jgi:hypothetical protein